MGTKKERHYDLVCEDNNPTWKFVVTDRMLKNKNGSVKAAVEKIIDIADDMKNEDWDLIIYGGMVAFKLPTERKTYIYRKDYWDSRCYENLTNLKIIKSNK